MYRKGEVRYQALPLPDRVQKDDAEALAAATDFLAYMRKRHSVRDYATKPVPEAIIAACIAAAGTAPSGANHQPWHFAAISDPAMKARIREGAEEEERAFYSGGEKSTGRMFSCYLSQAKKELVTIYVEGIGVASKDHLDSFEAFVTGLK